MQNSIPIDDVIDIATQAGELILENGGETYRAEETTVRVAQALGAKLGERHLDVVDAFLEANGRRLAIPVVLIDERNLLRGGKGPNGGAVVVE